MPHRTLSLRCASSALLLALAGALLGGCQVAPPPEPARPTAVAQARTPAPTPAPWPWGGGSDQQTALRLPNELLSIDLAVHPSEGWPAVAATTWGGPTTDPRSALVRVFNPTTARWGPALQVDVGPSSLGRDRFSRVALAVTADRTVVALWGASDARAAADGSTAVPPRIWTSQSRDYGASWSAPQPVASGCHAPVALAAAPDGQLAALLSCFSATWDGPALLTRRRDGSWGALQPVRVPSWYGADGALVVLGDGPEARAVALFHDASAGPAGRSVYLITRQLADPGPARVVRMPVPAASLPADSRFQHTQAHTFTRPGPVGTPQPGVIFTWTALESGRAYALTSLDGGASWGPAETVVALGGGRRVPFASPAYDPAADRLAVLWTCCDDALFETRPSSHYASWSAPGSGVWQTASAGAPVPLALGSRVASSSMVGQAQGGRTVWLAWVEAQRQLEVRSFDLSQVLPAEAMPTPSPVAQPQPEGATP